MLDRPAQPSRFPALRSWSSFDDGTQTEGSTLMRITQAGSADLPYVRDLFWDYLQWANGMVNQTFHVNFDIAAMLEHDMEGVDVFMPPDGRLLLASDTTDITGCV